MSAPKMTKPIPKPRPRTACDQVEDGGMCNDTDTEVFPAFGERDAGNGRVRKQWRLCGKHGEQHLAESIGGDRFLWALRQVIRQEVVRVAKFGATT